MRTLIGLLLSTVEKPIMKRTVKEYLWGYRDPILGALKDKFPSLVTNDQVSVFASAVINTFLLTKEKNSIDIC